MTALAAALQALPKVELHCHIEGAMRPGTVVELARANGVPLPTSDPTELYRYDSLDGFLRVTRASPPPRRRPARPAC